MYSSAIIPKDLLERIDSSFSRKDLLFSRIKLDVDPVISFSFKRHFSEDFEVSNLCTFFYTYLYKKNIKVTAIFNEVTCHILLVSTNIILRKILKFLHSRVQNFLSFYIIH